jgi:thioredoxin 1
MNDFQKAILDQKPVLVDFYADWCGPCRALAPELEKLKASMGDDVRILKVDVDKNPDVSAQFGVRSIPTMILFREGEILWRNTGALPAPQIETALNGALAAASNT